MKRLLIAAAALAFVTACPDAAKPGANKRAELRTLTGSSIEVAPTEGQLPYCLVFTITAHGTPPIIRQLTMTHENKSVPCEANRAIGGISYRVPIEEGKVRILVFFSDHKLSAGSVAQQIYELSASNPRFQTLDLRLPGTVYVESLDFDPQPDAPALAGGVVSPGGAVSAVNDGGATTGAAAEPAADGGGAAPAAAPAAADAGK